MASDGNRIRRESWPYQKLTILEPPNSRTGAMAPKLEFKWISLNLADSEWICMDFMDLGVFWGRKLGGLWQPVGRD